MGLDRKESKDNPRAKTSETFPKGPCESITSRAHVHVHACVLNQLFWAISSRGHQLEGPCTNAFILCMDTHAFTRLQCSINSRTLRHWMTRAMVMGC